MNLDLPLVLWTRQDFCSLLTGSGLIFAVSSYGMGKEGQKRSGVSLVSGLLRWPPQELASSGPNVSLNQIKIFVDACSTMSICCLSFDHER